MTFRTLVLLTSSISVLGIGACGGSVGLSSKDAAGTGGSAPQGTAGRAITGQAGQSQAGRGTGVAGMGTAGAPVQVTHAPVISRATAQSCQGVYNPPAPSNVSSTAECKTHADCTAGLNGKCVQGVSRMLGMTYCVYDTCQFDSECDPGKVCFCTASSAARCLSLGNCQTNADCGTGGYCSPSMGSDCGGMHSVDSFHCHTPNDTCVDDGDCTGRDYCNFNAYKNLWECTAPNNLCAVG